MKTISNSIITLMLLVTGTGLAHAGSTTAAVTRGERVDFRVIYDNWSGEYPSPVIDVNSKNKKGTTTVTGYKFLQTLDQPVQCKIKNGLYHPWSDSGRSANRYYTIAKSPKYLVIKDNSALTVPTKIGTLVSDVIYLSEGFCAANTLDNRSTPKKTIAQVAVGFECSELDNESNFRKISEHNTFEDAEQWINVTCASGEKVYVQDQTLLQADGVKEGEITGYGSVGPAPAN